VPELRVDFEIASALMQERSTSEPRVHLCCGQAGIDDVLLELGRRLGDVRSVERARARASRRMSYLGNDPDQWMQPNRGEGGIATLPGLMKGWSGIVLSLLRLSEPGDGTPCVLMLEP
jgi:lantibiotic modifying enzyme